METKEIIEVEVEEEVLASDAAPVETYSDEEIDEMTNQMKALIRANHYVSNDEIEALAKKIAHNSKDYLDSDTYLWTMYAYALRYRKMDDTNGRNAERFCFLRMNEVMKHFSKKKGRPEALTFVPSTLDERIVQEVDENTAFLQEIYKKLLKQFIGMELAMIFMLVSILLFIFHYDWFSIVIYCLIMAVLAYMFSYRSLKSKFLADQLSASKEFCHDEELLEFDLPVSNS